MNSKKLSSKAKIELQFIIYYGLSESIEKNKLDKEILEELLNWYKENVIISYNRLREKFDKIK